MLTETWSYLRMSTDEQEDSPATQGQMMAAFVAQHELPTWTRSYFDLGKSGGSLDKRRGMLTLLSEAERLRPAYIVFYRLDRAFRNAEEQAVALNRLKRLGVQVLKVRDPNLQGPIGELIDGILGNINQFERQLTGMRIRDHNEAMAQRGEWPGGPVPYGYRYRKPVKAHGRRKAAVIEPGGMEPDPAEWPIARQIWGWVIEGLRPAEVIERARTAGYVRRNGQLWDFAALSRMLQSKVYAGYVPFGHHAPGKGGYKREGGSWYLGKHVALVSPEQWHQVQAAMVQGNSGQRASRKPRAELAGLIRCRICGGSVGSSGALKSGQYLYTCIAAARGTVDHAYWSRSDWVLHMAVRQILDETIAYLPAELPRDDGAGRRQSLQQELARLQRQMGRLRELYVLGEFGADLPEYHQRKSQLEVQLAAKERALASAGPARDDLRRRHQGLQHWALAYQAAETVAQRQGFWRFFVEGAECDGVRLWVRLCDLGAAVPREWVVDLPPPGTKRPGVRSGRGIAGQAQDGRVRSRAHVAVRPVVGARDRFGP